MSESVQHADDCAQLRNRVSRLEDQIEHVFASRLQEQQARIDALEDTIQQLGGDVELVSERVESVIDGNGGSDSSPEQRAAALREAMIRASGDKAGSFSGGVTWWWKEVRDQLKTHGHGDFSKPTYHNAMRDAAEADGFEITTKEVITGGQRREVNAIVVNPADVTSAHLRNQFTTRVGVKAGQQHATADGGMIKTEETR